jgi:hypothetical protein
VKTNYLSKLPAAILVFLFLIATVAGCSQKVQTSPPKESATASTAPASASAQESAKPQESVKPQETAPAQETNDGPELNMMDVVSLKDTDADLIVTETEEIEDGDYLEDGEKYIGVWIFVKNTGEEPLYINYSPYILVDADGEEYEASLYTPGVMYDGAYVLPGGTFDGPVYFVVPKDATAYSLKAPQDLVYEAEDYVEIDLQEASDEPGDAAFAADPEDYYGDAEQIALNTALNYDDRLSVTVTDAKFVETDLDEAIDGYSFYQVTLTIENLTGEELDATLDYDYMLYSQAYNNMIRQISLPFADNELWVVTLIANEKNDYVLTFQVKEDSTVNFLFLQDFFEDNDPVLFELPS